MLKFFATGVLFLATTLPVKAQVGPGLGSSDRVASGVQSYAQVCTNSSSGRLSLRTGPGQNFGKIKEIPNGHTVGLIKGGYSQDGFWWWNVIHNNSRGWVRSDYVCGDPQ
ncbi:MAG: SH3 domain-containing protein [Hydrococcus sp. Prado102]|jgi:uncharacterized protein YraI|nr:SH3 domain-containing protein [Hydrococcus sp. Prado102]